MSIYSFRPVKKERVLLTGAGLSPLEVEGTGQTNTGAHPFISSDRKSNRKPWHPREIAPRCVSIFSQSLQERLRRGLCRTRQCCGWKRTARQRWTRTADLDSTPVVGWAPTSGRCSPLTPYHPWVCWALRTTTWAKVKTLQTLMVAAAHIKWIILNFPAVSLTLWRDCLFKKPKYKSPEQPDVYAWIWKAGSCPLLSKELSV